MVEPVSSYEPTLKTGTMLSIVGFIFFNSHSIIPGGFEVIL